MLDFQRFCLVFFSAEESHQRIPHVQLSGLLRLLSAATVSQTLLDGDDLDSFEELLGLTVGCSPIRICLMFFSWLDMEGGQGGRSRSEIPFSSPPKVHTVSMTYHC